MKYGAAERVKQRGGRLRRRVGRDHCVSSRWAGKVGWEATRLIT